MYMNKLPVYLYPNLYNVILDLDQSVDIKGINKVMYQRKIKIQKGFKDLIQIQFKNSDQKPISISSGTYYLDMLDSEGRQYVLNQSKELGILEYTTATGTSTTVVNKGLAVVSFDPADTINLTAGSYKFLVKKENDDGTFTPAYSNTYYGITGEIEIVEDGFPIGYPVQTVTMKQLEAGKNYNRDPNNLRYEFTTGWLRPVVRPVTQSTTSTANIVLASFVGDVVVEGTLDKDPSPPGQANAQYDTVTSFSTTTVTHGIISLSWNEPYAAVRFRVIPKKDPFGTNYYPTGNPVGSKTNKFPNGFVDQIEFIS